LSDAGPGPWLARRQCVAWTCRARSADCLSSQLSTSADGATALTRIGAGEHHPGLASSSSVQNAVRRWLLMLNATLLLAGLGLGAAGTRRGFFLAALVPLALAPFSYARWRLHCTLAPSLGSAADPWRQRLLVAGGVACDLILIAQLLTARAPDGVPALQGPM